MRAWLTVLAAVTLLGAGCIGPLAEDEDDERIDPAGDSDARGDEGENGSDEGSPDGPQAEFTSDCEGLNCSFDGSNSSDPDGEIASYDWNFGEESNQTRGGNGSSDDNETSDGNETSGGDTTAAGSATGARVAHTYSEAGTYTVTLTVENDDGETDTASETVTVTGETSQAEDDEAEWQHDNRTGTVSGTNALVTEASETEAFEVENGTEELGLNLTTDGDDLDVCIQAPTDEEGECTAEEQTESGQMNWSAAAPAGGEWTVELTAQGTGPQSVDYELVIATLVPPDAADNGTEDDGNDTLALGTSTPAHAASTSSCGAWSLLPSLTGSLGPLLP